MGRGRKDRKKWFCMETASQFLMEHVCVISLCMTDCRYSYNIPISDVHQAVTKVLVEMPLKENPTAQGKVSLTAVLKVSSVILDYFMISSEKLKRGWTSTASQYTKTRILKLQEQLSKIHTLHNKQTSNLHTHTHSCPTFQQIYLFRNPIDCIRFQDAKSSTRWEKLIMFSKDMAVVIYNHPSLP